MIKLSLTEAVELFGNYIQKQMIINMNGNLKADSVKSLLSKIEEDYESVTIKGRGKT